LLKLFSFEVVFQFRKNDFFLKHCSEDESDEASEEDIEVEAEIDEQGKKKAEVFYKYKFCCSNSLHCLVQVLLSYEMYVQKVFF
jgi:hypothetical protein